MKKLIFTFRNFAEEPKKEKYKNFFSVVSPFMD
jgi:hypothetical protein